MTFMLGKVVITAAMLAYVAYRVSFSLRSARARRAGDDQVADLISQKGYKVFRAATGLLTLCLFIYVIVLIAQ